MMEDLSGEGSAPQSLMGLGGLTMAMVLLSDHYLIMIMNPLTNLKQFE